MKEFKRRMPWCLSGTAFILVITGVSNMRPDLVEAGLGVAVTAIAFHVLFRDWT